MKTQIRIPIPLDDGYEFGELSSADRVFAHFWNTLKAKSVARRSQYKIGDIYEENGVSLGRVSQIRVERLQDISEEDAIAEGVKYIYYGDGTDIFLGRFKTWVSVKGFDTFHNGLKRVYRQFWDSINTEKEKQWEANPYVFVYKFESVEKPKATS